MSAPSAPAPLRCPRCRRDAPAAARLCPACGAPLLLGDERVASALDVDLDLDRRRPGRGGIGAHPVPAVPEPALTPLPDAAVEDPAADALFASSVADLEGPYWMEGIERARAGAGAASAPRATPHVQSEPPPPSSTSTSTSTATDPPAPAPATATAPAPATPTSTSTPTPTPTPTSRAPSTEARGPRPEAPAPRPSVLEVHVTRADPWRRAVAWALDGGPFVAAAWLLAEWLGHQAAGAEATPPDPAALAALVDRERVIALSVAAVAALALAVYATLAHALAGATLGKRLIGIRVVGPDGRRPSPGRSAVRSAVAGLSVALLGLGFLVSLFSRTGRALHDVVAGTWVVKAP